MNSEFINAIGDLEIEKGISAEILFAVQVKSSSVSAFSNPTRSRKPCFISPVIFSSTFTLASFTLCIKTLILS